MRDLVNVLWILVKLIILASIIALGSCTTIRTLLKQAPTNLPSGWDGESANLLPEPVAWQRLEARLYGPLNITPQVEFLEQRIIADHPLSEKAELIEWRMRIGYGAAERDLDLVALLPLQATNSPVILSQNFCPNHNVIPFDGISAPSTSGFDCSGGGLFGALMTRIFGRYIVKPPIEDILDRGYGFAALYPSQFVPDQSQAGQNTLEALFPDAPSRPGALSVWASLFDLAATTIEGDSPDRQMIAYGHSRFAKTALLAGAVSNRIDMVVAHQSGTLGASTLDDRDGESLGALIEDYPHWPASNAKNYADDLTSLGVRPADLLARLDDKPVLLGNARRDVWSDPWGAFKEARTAWGKDFGAQSPSDFRPGDSKSYWLRPGTHGVVKEDWPAFLDFLDANRVQSD